MDEKIKSVMFKMIKSEICGAPLDAQEINILSASQLEELYTFTQKHDIANIIASAGEKNGWLDFKDEIHEKFLVNLKHSFISFRKKQIELNNVSKCLEESKIRHIPLKGSVIHRYYPKPWLRTSGDIDILVNKNDFEKSVDILCDKYHFDKSPVRSHDITLTSESGIHIELHFTLIEEGIANNANNILKNVWHYASPCQGYEYRCELSDEMFYFYHIAHTAKHFKCAGCGIRPFIDLWILDNKFNYDKSKRDELLNKCDLLKFADCCRKLSEFWFSDKKQDNITYSIQEYVLSSGIHGNIHNLILLNKSDHKGKINYLMSRLFISNDSLKIKYPILKKQPFLIPFYQIKRWLKVLIPATRKRALQEVKISSNISNDEINNLNSLFDKIGIR